MSEKLLEFQLVTTMKEILTPLKLSHTNFINTLRQEPESIRLFPLNDLSSMVEKLHSRFQSESQTNQKDNREILIENKDVVLSELASPI